MSKKDYERAVQVAHGLMGHEFNEDERAAIVRAFVALFKENPRFDAVRFSRACIPGANVRARS